MPAPVADFQALGWERSVWVGVIRVLIPLVSSWGRVFIYFPFFTDKLHH